MIILHFLKKKKKKKERNKDHVKTNYLIDILIYLFNQF